MYIGAYLSLCMFICVRANDNIVSLRQEHVKSTLEVNQDSFVDIPNGQDPDATGSWTKVCLLTIQGF